MNFRRVVTRDIGAGDIATLAKITRMETGQSLTILTASFY